MAMSLQEYFIDPILANGYFNPVNTTVYALLLVAAVYIVFKIISKLQIPIDRMFFYAIFPFIVWGSSTRVLHDAAFANALPPGIQEFYAQPFFPTPGSYLITFGLAITVFLISIGIMRLTHGRIAYWKPMAAIGTVLVLVNLAITPWKNFVPLAEILGLTFGLIAAVFVASRILRLPSIQARFPGASRLLSINHQVILGGHFLDASATFVALSLYGYFEQHVVPNVFISLIGPVAMFPLKLFVVLPVLWILDRYAEAGSFKNFLLIVIFILGFAPGLRDLLRLVAGV